MRFSEQQKNDGFTLLELSVVLVILSLIIAAIFATSAQKNRISKMQQLQTQMDTIEAALIAYAKQNYTLPCPARPNQAITGSNGGTSFCTASTWNTTYTTRSAQQTQPDGVTTSYILAGVLPFITLGLPEEYEVDPWGNRFTYAVDEVLTATAPTTGNSGFYGMIDNNLQKSVGKITVTDGSNTLTSNAVVVVISHGPNGNGAFPFAARNATTRRAGGSDTNETTNCKCNATTGAVTAYSPTYVQRLSGKTSASNADTFDDIVRYYTRSQFLSSADLQNANP